MLNYIRAELWKVFRRRRVYGILAVLLAGESLLALTAWVPQGRSLPLHMAGILTDALPFGIFVALLMAHLVFHDQHKLGTLKNEVTFGIPRSRIYLGKTLSGLIVGLICAGIVVGSFMAVTLLRSRQFPEPETAAALWEEFSQALCALPLWIGGLGLAAALCFLCRSGSTSIAGYMLLLVVTPVSLGVVADNMYPGGMGFQVFDTLRQGNLLEVPLIPEFSAQPAQLWHLLRSWGIGMGWFWGSTAVGLAVFRRKEIR